jgi:hypothetical protein
LLAQNHLLKFKKSAIMLTQFRKLYPHGSIISELLKMDRGKYIVRVLVQIEGVTLATGMAAADTIESAEDSARNRALALLEPLETAIVPEKPEIQPQIALVPQAKETVKPTFPAPKKEVEISEPTFKPSPLPETSSYNTPEREPEFSKNTSALYEPEPLVLDSEEQAMPTGQSFANATEPLDKSAFIAEPELEAEPEIATSYKLSLEDAVTAPPTSPVGEQLDPHEIIERTDLLMKQLGWTNEKGRTYLKETYGKRSRHLLNDDELLQFLQYLENQAA